MMNKDHFEVEECFVGVNRTSPMTNGDRIRAMSDEELAKIISDGGCPPKISEIVCETTDDCNVCWRNWLKQPCGGRVMAECYVCDACGIAITNPYTVKMKEFYVGCEFSEIGVFHARRHAIKKVHLCYECYHALNEIAKEK
jgi:hypothetical protein